MNTANPTPSEFPFLIQETMRSSDLLHPNAVQACVQKAIDGVISTYTYAERRKQRELLKAQKAVVNDGFCSFLDATEGAGKEFVDNLVSEMGFDQEHRDALEQCETLINFALSSLEYLGGISDYYGVSERQKMFAFTTAQKACGWYATRERRDRVFAQISKSQQLGIPHDVAKKLPGPVEQEASIESETEQVWNYLLSQFCERAGGDSSQYRTMDSAWTDVPHRSRMILVSSVWSSLATLTHWGRYAVASAHDTYKKNPQRFVEETKVKCDEIGSFVEDFQQCIDHEYEQWDEADIAKLNIQEPKSCEKVLDEAIRKYDQQIATYAKAHAEGKAA